MHNFKKYDNYKNYGIKWIGEIPAHWKAERNFVLFFERNERGFNDHELLSVTIGKGIIKQSEIEIKKDTSNEDKTNYKRVCNGDIAYNKMRMWQGAVGKSDYEGIVSPAYVVLRPRKILDIRYYHYLFRTPIYMNESYRNAYGIVDDQHSLRYYQFKAMYSIYPPYEEQKKIANFLDEKTKKIDDYIAKKQRIIELLKEQKNAIINKAVTKGIDPLVKMKDSGVEWLDEIPENWEVKKLKYISKSIFSNVDKHSFNNEISVRLCNYIDVYNNNFIYNNMGFMKATATQNEIEKFKLFKGDVVITKDSETSDDIAVPAFIKEELQNVICGYHLAIIRTKKDVIGEYIFRLFISKDFNHHFAINANGITRMGLAINILKDALILIPPKNEQMEITEFIMKEEIRINHAIQKIEKEISFIHEYRTSLITEAVTGKICIV